MLIKYTGNVWLQTKSNTSRSKPGNAYWRRSAQEYPAEKTKNQQQHHPCPKCPNESWNGTRNGVDEMKQSCNKTYKKAILNVTKNYVINKPESDERSEPEKQDEPNELPKLSKTGKNSTHNI